MSAPPADDLAGLDLTESMHDVRAGLVVKPLLVHYLRNARELSIPAVRHSMEPRDPDGWFHPSSHPGWSDSALYWYLARPDLMQGEVLGYESRMSVLWGTAFHGFVGPLLERIGIAPVELNRCTTCPKGACPSGGTEPGFESREILSRTHADKVLRVPGREKPVLFELKSGQDNTYVSYNKLKKMRDLDNDDLRESYPGYWEQAQNVQLIAKLMTGDPEAYDLTVLVMVAWGFPWEIREFHVGHDPEYAAGLAERYRRTIQAAADQRPPRCLCSRAAATECPARGVCGR